MKTTNNADMTRTESNAVLMTLKAGDTITDGTSTRRGPRTYTVVRASFGKGAGFIVAQGARGGSVDFVMNIRSGKWSALRMAGMTCKSTPAELSIVSRAAGEPTPAKKEAPAPRAEEAPKAEEAPAPTVKDPAIAENIRRQLGAKTLFMLNAKHLIDHGNGLSFRIVCRGSKANHVKITLEPSDTYRIEINKIGRAPSYKITNKLDASGVYADMLHGLIEEHTGLAVHMPRIRMAG